VLEHDAIVGSVRFEVEMRLPALSRGKAKKKYAEIVSDECRDKDGGDGGGNGVGCKKKKTRKRYRKHGVLGVEKLGRCKRDRDGSGGGGGGGGSGGGGDGGFVSANKRGSRDGNVGHGFTAHDGFPLATAAAAAAAVGCAG
jgi:hypothetical protein